MIHLIYLIWTDKHAIVYFTHCGLVASYGDAGLGQYWLGYRISAWQHQAIHIKTILQEMLKMFTLDTVKPVCNDHLYEKIYHLWFIQ